MKSFICVLLALMCIISARMVMSSITETGASAERDARALLFRPLFVYRQQQINKVEASQQKLTMDKPQYAPSFAYPNAIGG